MKRIFLSSGHSNAKTKDQGAVSGNITEGQLAVDLKNIIAKSLRDRKVPILCDMDDMVTKETVNYFEKHITPDDIAIDLHFNASNSHKGTGCEAVVPSDYTVKEIDLARFIVAAISEQMQIKNRGVITEDETPRGSLMFMSLDCTTVLIEVCFMDNANDLNNYKKFSKEVGITIANILYNYARL